MTTIEKNENNDDWNYYLIKDDYYEEYVVQFDVFVRTKITLIQK